MKTIRLVVLALCCSLGVTGPSLFAQGITPPHAPEIRAALNSGDELLADLKFLSELAGPQGVRGWKLLESFLAEIFSGTDTSKPAIFDVLLIPSGTEVRAHFPLQIVAGKPLGAKFLANLKTLGIDNKRLANNSYQLGGGKKEIAGAAFNGFLRILPAPVNYASIAKKSETLPANLADPTKDKIVVALLAKKFDVGMLLKNDKLDEASIKARRTDFQKVRDELIAGLKQLPDTKTEIFAVQKALLEHNLNELDRFIAESAELSLGWTTDAPKKESRLDFELDAIPNSDLDTSAKLLGQAPGMFSGVPRSEQAILSGRIHFPLDGLRKAAAIGGVPLLRAQSNVQIDDSKTATAEQKVAMKAAAKVWYDMLQDGANEGVIDGLIEVSQAKDEKANLVFGLKAKDGTAVKGILEQLPQMDAAYKVQLDVEKVGDYAIHTITLPENDEDFELLFGKGAAAYVAAGPKAFWIAIGPKSLEPLKKAIADSAQPNAALANNFLTLYYRVAPWLELVDARRTRLDAKPSDVKSTDAELKNKKDRTAHRKLALEVLKEGKDSVETKLDAKNGHISGSTRLEEGILKFMGAETAKFSNETLK
ncbi:MAG: hypothetical protein FD138_1450 [Planctomycetota bacterium]|nr:MAG: hypothetical protein FD138_1450 [Planctomycetota bacterium]